MPKLRVFQLARELNRDNSEIIFALQRMGVPITSHSNTVEDRLAERIRKDFGVRCQPQEQTPPYGVTGVTESQPPMIANAIEAITWEQLTDEYVRYYFPGAEGPPNWDRLTEEFLAWGYGESRPKHDQQKSADEPLVPPDQRKTLSKVLSEVQLRRRFEPSPDRDARLSALHLESERLQSDVLKITAQNERIKAENEQLKIHKDKQSLEVQRLQEELERAKAEVTRTSAQSAEQVVWTPQEKHILGKVIDLYNKGRYDSAIMGIVKTLEKLLRGYLGEEVTLGDVITIDDYAQKVNLDPTMRAYLDILRVMRNHTAHEDFEPRKTDVIWSIKSLSNWLETLSRGFSAVPPAPRKA